MGRRLAGWRALTWRERGLLVLCTIGLTMIHAALALLGYRRTRRAIEALSHRRSTRPASTEDLLAAQRLARLSAIAGRHGPAQATCLRQSLFLYGWLRRRGLQPALHLGVIERDGPFQAHAWVELDGTRLLPGDTGHRPFAGTSHV